MDPQTATPAPPARPLLVTLACLVGFAGVPMTAYIVIVNRAALVAYNGWPFIWALIVFGAMGVAGLVGYWTMRRWGLYLYAAMTALSLLYALNSGSFSLSSSLSSLAITAIGCAYYARMK